MQLFPTTILKKKKYVIHIVAVVAILSCVFGVLAQPASAQNTYVITDGDQVITYTSYSSDPAKILSEAGLSLENDDTFTTQVTTEGVSEITVQRSQRIVIDNCGQLMEVNSYGETVDALLSRVGVPSKGEYSASVALNAETYDGMQLSVVHTLQNEETYTVEIPFEVNTVQDPSLPEGQEKILVEGIVGIAQRKANVVYENTREVSRTVLEETVLEQPVNQVVAVGTGESVGVKSDAPLIGDGVIVLPTGEVLTYTRTDTYYATAYHMSNDGCDEYTATGSRVHVGVVAVDPEYISYGTRMFIVSNDGQYIYGIGTAEDCGTGIDGKRLDLYMNSNEECFQFGYRSCTVYFLGGANWR